MTPDRVLSSAPAAARSWPADAAAIADWLKAGGNLLAIGLDEADANAFLPFKVAMKKAEHIAAYFEPLDAKSLLAGVGPADVHNRDPRELPLVTAGATVIGDGVLAQAEDVNVVFCQLVPWQFDHARSRRTSSGPSAAPRSSYRGCAANMGVAGATPILARFRRPRGGRPSASNAGWTASTSTSRRNGTTRTASSAGDILVSLRSHDGKQGGELVQNLKIVT